MKTSKSLTRRQALVSLLGGGLSILLIGCSGGGVVPTPTPTPAPSGNPRPSKTIVVSGDTAGAGYGLLYFDSNTRTAVRETPGLATSPRYFTTTPDGGVIYNTGRALQRVNPDGSMGSGSTSLASTISDLVLLPSGNVLVHNSSGFSVFEGSSLTLLDTNRNDIYSSVYDLQVGPDGKLYVIGVRSNTYVVDRYTIGSGDTLQLEGTLTSVRTSDGYDFRGVAFVGDEMILVNTKGDNLLRYTTDLPAQPLGASPLIASISGPLAVGHDVFNDGDQVLFVVTANGVRAIGYSTGAFTLLDSHNAEFIRHSAAIDVAVR